MTKKFTIDLIDDQAHLNHTKYPHYRYINARKTISNWLDAYAKIVKSHNLSSYEDSFKNEEKDTDLMQLAHKQAMENDDNIFHEAVAQLLFALNHVLGLKELSQNPNIHLLRTSAISWYYAIYHSSRLMITLKNKAIPYGTHAKTIKTWQDIFVYKAIKLPEPYNIMIASLVQKDLEEQIKTLKKGIKLTLKDQANTYDECLSHWA